MEARCLHYRDLLEIFESFDKETFNGSCKFPLRCVGELQTDGTENRCIPSQGNPFIYFLDQSREPF